MSEYTSLEYGYSRPSYQTREQDPSAQTTPEQGYLLFPRPNLLGYEYSWPCYEARQGWDLSTQRASNQNSISFPEPKYDHSWAYSQTRQGPGLLSEVPARQNSLWFPEPTPPEYGYPYSYYDPRQGHGPVKQSLPELDYRSELSPLRSAEEGYPEYRPGFPPLRWSDEECPEPRPELLPPRWEKKEYPETLYESPPLLYAENESPDHCPKSPLRQCLDEKYSGPCYGNLPLRCTEEDYPNIRIKSPSPVQEQDSPTKIVPKQDPLSELEGVVPCKSISAIVEGAFNSIHMIEPWRTASTDHPQLQQVIQKIQCHTIVYFEAIDTSIKTAQDGYSFSCDEIELCGYLLDPGTGTDDLQEYIRDMQSKAKRAHEDSLMTLNKFRDVRKGLIEITKTIPKEAFAGPEGSKGFFIKLLSPLIGGKRDVSLESAIKEIHLAALDMAKLADNVDKFADWWSGMETVLKKAEKSASDLRPGKDKLRLKGIQRTWTTIRDDYKHYKVQIIQLQDYYTQN